MFKRIDGFGFDHVIARKNIHPYKQKIRVVIIHVVKIYEAFGHNI